MKTGRGELGWGQPIGETGTRREEFPAGTKVGNDERRETGRYVSETVGKTVEQKTKDGRRQSVRQENSNRIA